MPVTRKVILHNVPAQLRAELVRRDLTQGEAAQRVGISRPVFNYILHGRYTLSIETAFKIEAAFGMDARRLLHAQLNEDIAQHLALQERKRRRCG